MYNILFRSNQHPFIDIPESDDSFDKLDLNTLFLSYQNPRNLNYIKYFLFNEKIVSKKKKIGQL